jgi:hydrogenase-4 membrane subunit HyfE
MPFIVDMGILVILIAVMLAMSMLVLIINRKFESIDINNLKKLKG